MVKAERRALNAQELFSIKWHADKDKERRDEAATCRDLLLEDDYSGRIQVSAPPHPIRIRVRVRVRVRIQVPTPHHGEISPVIVFGGR